MRELFSAERGKINKLPFNTNVFFLGGAFEGSFWDIWDARGKKPGMTCMLKSEYFLGIPVRSQLQYCIAPYPVASSMINCATMHVKAASKGQANTTVVDSG